MTPSFSDSFASQVDIATGVVSVKGPDAGVHTLLFTIQVDVGFPHNRGFTIGFEPDDAFY